MSASHPFVVSVAPKGGPNSRVLVWATDSFDAIELAQACAQPIQGEDAVGEIYIVVKPASAEECIRMRVNEVEGV